MTFRRSLGDVYAELNARFWNGRLPPPATLGKGPPFPVHNEPQLIVHRVSLRALAYSQATGGPYCLGRFVPPAQSSPARIQVLTVGDEGERQLLLHQMVHCSLFVDGVPHEHHGDRFVAELDRLATAGEPWAKEQADYYRGHTE